MNLGIQSQPGLQREFQYSQSPKRKPKQEEQIKLQLVKWLGLVLAYAMKTKQNLGTKNTNNPCKTWASN